MRVLSVVSSLDPSRGGTQAATTNMVLASQGAGVENTIVCAGSADARGRSGALIEQLAGAGVKVHELPGLPVPGERVDRWGISPRQASWVMRHLDDVELLHVHGVWGVGLLAALAAGRRRRIPIVVSPYESFTDFDIDHSRSSARRRQKLFLKSFYLRWATLFIVTSELEGRDSFPESGQARVRVIPAPVPTAGANHDAAAVDGRGDALRVGFIGRIDPKKNLDLLLDAIASLPVHVSLTVIGDGHGDLPDRLRQQSASLGLEERVEWAGFVSPDERGKALDQLDLVVLPSAFESFGMAAAEAMTHGVPVLVSRRTGIAEVVARQGGGVATEPDARAIAAALAELDAEPDTLAELGRQARAAAAVELTMAQAGAAMRQAYEDAVALGPGAPVAAGDPVR